MGQLREEGPIRALSVLYTNSLILMMVPSSNKPRITLCFYHTKKQLVMAECQTARIRIRRRVTRRLIRI